MALASHWTACTISQISTTVGTPPFGAGVHLDNPSAVRFAHFAHQMMKWCPLHIYCQLFGRDGWKLHLEPYLIDNECENRISHPMPGCGGRTPPTPAAARRTTPFSRGKPFAHGICLMLCGRQKSLIYRSNSNSASAKLNSSFLDEVGWVRLVLTEKFRWNPGKLSMMIEIVAFGGS